MAKEESPNAKREKNKREKKQRKKEHKEKLREIEEGQLLEAEMVIAAALREEERKGSADWLRWRWRPLGLRKTCR